MDILCSSGAFSRHPDQTDYRAILQQGPLLHADGVEVLFYAAWYGAGDQIAADLCATGLRFPAVHGEKSLYIGLGSTAPGARAAALARLAANCRLAQAIGAARVILHLWGLPETDSYLAAVLPALPACLDLAAAHGVRLAVETLPAIHADPLTLVRRVMDADPRWEVVLDTEFLAYHDQVDAVLDADWLWAAGRVRHIHIKDYEPPSARGPQRRYLHPGEGHLDFPAFFARLRERRFTGAISLESAALDATGTVDHARIQASLDYLRRLAAAP